MNGKLGCLLLFLGALIFISGLYALDRIPGADLLGIYIADAVTFAGILVIMLGALLILARFHPKRALLTTCVMLQMLLLQIIP
ncbi:MAG: hypothetical protein QXP36_04990, partial [Conexivisphaerales archaeon]